MSMMDKCTIMLIYLILMNVRNTKQIVSFFLNYKAST